MSEKAFAVHPATMVHPSQLVPAGYNPNEQSPKEYEALKQSILDHGFVEPVVVQKIGMRIIGGHHRVRAIKEIAIEAGEQCPEIPCIVLDISDADAKKLNLKLQHIHGNPNARLLGELLLDIYQDQTMAEDDVSLLGLDYDDALKFVRLIEPEFAPGTFDEQGQLDVDSGFARSITLSLEFETTKARDAVRAILEERVTLLKKKSGDVVAEAFLRKPKPKAKAKPIKKRRLKAA